MKKQSTMFLTFSALLSLNAFAPQVLWNQHASVERSPASESFSVAEYKHENIDTDQKIKDALAALPEIKREKVMKEFELSDLKIDTDKSIKEALEALPEIRQERAMKQFEVSELKIDANGKVKEALDQLPTIKRERVMKEFELSDLKIDTDKSVKEALEALPPVRQVRAMKLFEITDLKIDTDKKIKEALEKLPEIKVDTVAAQCMKDKQPKLEDRIEKLLADKEDILKEIEGLKKKAKTVKREEIKKAYEGDSSRFDNTSIVALMSQMTSMMFSQQQQQTMMMSQMFSMMAAMQPQQSQGLNMSPYAYVAHESTYMSNQPFGPSNRVGLGYQYREVMQSPYMQEQEYYRAPSAQGEQQRQQPINNNVWQPQFQNQYMPHDGFAFGNSNNLERVSMNQEGFNFGK